ncbi:MAG: hypothetical protein AAF986_02375 [Pseudomonadota bacterium]
MTKHAATMVVTSIFSMLLSTSAVAGNGKFSAGYNRVSNDEVSLGAIVTRYNRKIIAYRNINFGAEAELSYGVIGDETAFLSQEIEVNAEFGMGLFSTISYPLTDKGSSIFLRLGYAQQETGNRIGDTIVTDEAKGFAYGLGGNWMMTKRQGVRADALKIQGDDDEVDLYGLSYVFQH